MFTFAVIVLAAIPLFYLFQRWNILRKSPLNRLPGPWIAKWSNVSHSWLYLAGRQTYDMIEMHNKYGPVVRTAPNEVSFNTSSACKDIYAPRKGHQRFLKADFYDRSTFGGEAASIITERDPERHAVWRKQLSTAFSDRSVRDYEHIVETVVDALVARLEGSCGDAKGVRLDPCFTMVTFDIMGHTSLGHDFGSVARGEKHPWAVALSSGLRMMVVNDTMHKFPLLGRVARWLFSTQIERMLADRDKHEQYTIDLVKERLKDADKSPDFISHAVKVRDAGSIQVTEMEMAALGSDLVIAGTETSATGLCCIFYYLLTEPGVLAELRAELDRAFTHQHEVTPAALGGLKYLDAVIMEGLRLYPPLPIPLYRAVPPGGDTVDGHFLPGGTVVAANPMASNLSPNNFSDPWAFKPERWLDPDCTDDLEACRPFSLGPRNCIGQNLAWMEIRTTIAKLIFKFDFTLINKDVDWHRDSRMHTLWQNPPLWVRVEPRAGKGQ